MSFQYTRPESLPPIVKNLVIINALVFLAQVVLDDQYQITEHLALYPVNGPDFKQDLFVPGEYQLRILFDRNKNGVWDGGQFFGMLIPAEYGGQGLPVLLTREPGGSPGGDAGADGEERRAAYRADVDRRAGPARARCRRPAPVVATDRARHDVRRRRARVA